MTMKARGTILVVVDDEHHGEVARLLLEGMGHHVLLETAAAAALPRTDDPALDVVLTDLRMEGMDGAELCRRVRETHPELPVVIMTGDTSTGEVEATHAGAFDFLGKPIDVERLVQAIGRAVRHHHLMLKLVSSCLP